MTCRDLIAPIRWQNYSQARTKAAGKAAREDNMSNSQAAPGVVGPFAGLDVPWLLRMRAESRRNHPFLIWAPFDAPARSWSYGEFHERVGALAAGLVKARRQARRICADPSRQLHRGHAGLVCLRRTRRHRGDHQHPLGGGRDGIFRRSLRRGRRHHPARLCRTDLGAIAAICAGSP